MPRTDPQDARTIRRTVMLSPRVAALIEREAGPRSSGGWIWEAALEKLERDTGYTDTARRQAPRRANYRARAGKQREEGQER